MSVASRWFFTAAEAQKARSTAPLLKARLGFSSRSAAASLAAGPRAAAAAPGAGRLRGGMLRMVGAEGPPRRGAGGAGRRCWSSWGS